MAAPTCAEHPVAVDGCQRCTARRAAEQAAATARLTWIASGRPR